MSSEVPPSPEPCTPSNKKGPIQFLRHLPSLWIAFLLRPLLIRLQGPPARCAHLTTWLPFPPSTMAASGHYMWSSSPSGLECVALVTRYGIIGWCFANSDRFVRTGDPSHLRHVFASSCETSRLIKKFPSSMRVFPFLMSPANQVPVILTFRSMFSRSIYGTPKEPAK